MQIRPFQDADADAVIDLWTRCRLTRPWNDPRQDIARILADHPERFLVGTLNDLLMATALYGYDGHRGWVYYLAVDPDLQGRGCGRQLMDAVEARLLQIGCPKLNLMVRTENSPVLEFYEHLGFRRDEVVCLGKRLIADD